MLLPLSRSHLGFLERSPPIAVAVEGTVTGDGDVLCVERIERAGATLGRDALKPLVVDLIQIEVVRENDETVLLRIESHVGLERERRGRVDSFRDDDRSASGFCASIDSRLDGFSRECYTGVVRSEIEHVKGAIRKVGHCHFGHVEGSGFGQAIDVALLRRLVLRRFRTSAHNSCGKQQECDLVFHDKYVFLG